MLTVAVAAHDIQPHIVKELMWSLGDEGPNIGRSTVVDGHAACRHLAPHFDAARNRCPRCTLMLLRFAYERSSRDGLRVGSLNKTSWAALQETLLRMVSREEATSVRQEWPVICENHSYYRDSCCGCLLERLGNVDVRRWESLQGHLQRHLQAVGSARTGNGAER